MGSGMLRSEEYVPIVMKVRTLYIERHDTFIVHQREKVLLPTAWEQLLP
jgi:hypothetical protein